MQVLIVGRALVCEVLGQVVIRIAEAAGVPDPDFLAPDFLAQGVQDAQFVIQATDLLGLTGIVLGDGFAPAGRHDLVEGNGLGAGEMGLGQGDIDVLLEQFQCLDDGLVDFIVRAEGQVLQDDWHHAPVMFAVGSAHRLLYLLLIGGAASFIFFDQVAQGLFAHHWKDHLANGAIGLVDRRFR